MTAEKAPVCFGTKPSRSLEESGRNDVRYNSAVDLFGVWKNGKETSINNSRRPESSSAFRKKFLNDWVHIKFLPPVREIL